MSIFKKDTVIDECVAYKTVTREMDSYGRINVSAGDLLVHGNTTYSIASVVSYSLSKNQCSIAAVERAKNLGHDLYWISQNAICLSSSKQKQETMLKVDLDATYRFEGKAFHIKPAPNDNLKFSYIEDASL